MQNKPKKNQNINFLFFTIHLAFSLEMVQGCGCYVAESFAVAQPPDYLTN
jgi:hypothetical protein